MGHWDTCRPRLATIYFFLPHSGAIKVFRQSLMSNVFGILRITVIKISLFFILLKKKRKGYIGFFATQFCVILRV